jgi:hypothetical protein
LGLFLPVLLLSCLVLPDLFGGGKNEEEAAAEPLNKEWVLCVTSLDVSALPESRRIMGNIIAANLAASLASVDHRLRLSPEHAYYEGAAWSKNRGEAAKKIAAKREERDRLLYKGEPDWKYRRDLKVIDAALKTLEEDYQKAEARYPPVFAEPQVKLTEENSGGAFPAPPEAGREYRFCSSRKLDAFITGAVSEYHNRIYVVLRLYTRYSRSYQFEDSSIFSPEDMGIAMEELAGRLTAAVAGTAPAAIRVYAEPEDAMVLVNGAFAGRGEVPPLEHSPGKVEVTVMAENHVSAAVPLEIAGGELAELYINLRPLALNAFTVTLPPEMPSASVYRGSLYAGETPLSLEVPLNRHEYIRLETMTGGGGTAIIQGGDRVREGSLLTIKTSPAREEKQVDKYRRRFYGAWGRFWLVLPAAFMIQGIADIDINAYNYRGYADLYDSATLKYYISVGAWVATVISAADLMFNLVRYVYVSGKNETTLIN